MGLKALAGVLLPGLLLAGGLDPLPQASSYPAHGRAGDMEVGAEYLVRGAGVAGRGFITRHYLVIDVGVYPPRGVTSVVKTSEFSLRVNGKTLLSQTAGMVAASLKFDDWEQHGEMTAVVGMGDGAVVLGRSRNARFPGDRRSPEARTPTMPRAPSSVASPVEKQEVRPEEVVLEDALPEGRVRGPVRGYLYFPYPAKTKSIKSVELRYQGSAGELRLRLP